MKIGNWVGNDFMDTENGHVWGSTCTHAVSIMPNGSIFVLDTNYYGIALYTTGTILVGQFDGSQKLFRLTRAEWSNGMILQPDAAADPTKEYTGRFHWPNGDIYDGSFRKYFPHGKGTKFFITGDRLEGNWVKGVCNGPATWFYKNGDRLDGNWVKGVCNGPAMLFYNSGARVEGNWVNRVCTGPAKMFFNSGARVEGNWVNGVCTGPAKMFSNSGDRLEGNWINGGFNGPVKVFYNSGGIHTFNYKDGKIV